MCQDTEDIFRDLALDIAKYGTQGWNPPRPTPPMANVILAIAKSLEKELPKHDRCHVILLSPVFDVLHTVSATFPNLRVHQVNPAILPYIPNEEHREAVCSETCCENVFVSNWTHYQSVPNCIKQVILQARSETPIGKITDLHVDIRPKSGCEVLEIEGPTNMSTLRLGQAFCFFVRIRVSSSETQVLDVTSVDPILEHSLDTANLRQEIYVADMVDAKLAHLLSVQVFYKNILNPVGTWSYAETPLLAIKELGRLAQPHDLSSDVYRRRAFHLLSKIDNAAALKEVEKLSISSLDEAENIQQVIQQMAKEVHWHHAVLEYEGARRQKLPSCAGPIGEQENPVQCESDTANVKIPKKLRWQRIMDTFRPC